MAVTTVAQLAAELNRPAAGDIGRVQRGCARAE